MSSFVPLGPAQVHIWRIPLDRAPEAVSGLYRTLSDDEQKRADTQAGERLQRRFVVAHAETRRILAGYLGEDPRELVFDVSAQGKPHRSSGDRDVRFNLSHSGELALLAVSSSREVGIDVEWVDPRRDLGGLLPAFAPDERAELERLVEGERRAAIFAAWTRKEAILKGMGRGIGWGLAASDRAPGEGAEDRARWTLIDIECGADYRGTLAAEGSGWEMRVFDSAEP